MAYQAGVNPALPQYNSGVVPVTTEPLNTWQKQGLASLANLNHGGMLQASTAAYQNFANNPAAYAKQYISPEAMSSLYSMNNAISAGTAGMTMDALAGFMNPYTSEVTDATLRGIEEDEARRRASLLSKQGMRGGRSFGDSSSAIQMSELARNMDILRGDTRAKLNYQGFSDAVGQFNTERSRDLQAAGLYGDAATRAQDIYSSGIGTGGQVIGGMVDLANNLYDQRRNASLDQIKAGSLVRDYNQGIANQIAGEIDSVVNLEPNRLTELANYLKAFTPSQYQYVDEPDSLARAGSYAVGAGKFADYLNTPTINDLPWTSPGNVNPNGGFYL